MEHRFWNHTRAITHWFWFHNFVVIDEDLMINIFQMLFFGQMIDQGFGYHPSRNPSEPQSLGPQRFTSSLTLDEIWSSVRKKIGSHANGQIYWGWSYSVQIQDLIFNMSRSKRKLYKAQPPSKSEFDQPSSTGNYINQCLIVYYKLSLGEKYNAAIHTRQSII